MREADLIATEQEFRAAVRQSVDDYEAGRLRADQRRELRRTLRSYILARLKNKHSLRGIDRGELLREFRREEGDESLDPVSRMRAGNSIIALTLLSRIERNQSSRPARGGRRRR